MRRGVGGDAAHSPDPSLTSIAAGVGVTRRRKSYHFCRQKQNSGVDEGCYKTVDPTRSQSQTPLQTLGPLSPMHACHLTESRSLSHSRSWCSLLRPSSTLACPPPPPRPAASEIIKPIVPYRRGCSGRVSSQLPPSQPHHARRCGVRSDGVTDSFPVAATAHWPQTLFISFSISGGWTPPPLPDPAQPAGLAADAPGRRAYCCGRAPL